MDVYKELELYITTLNPKLKLGDESLKLIKYTKANKKDQKIMKENNSKELVISFSSKDMKDAEINYEKVKKTIRKTKHKEKTREKKRIHESCPEDSVFNIKLPIKRKNKILCPCCDWIFPNEYQEDDMNEHVELCVEGNGGQDIKSYMKNAKKIKKKEERKKKYRKKHRKVFENNQNYEVPSEEPVDSMEIEEKPIFKCPDCNLSLSHRCGRNFSSIHLINCKQEQMTFISKIKPKMSFRAFKASLKTINHKMVLNKI